MLKFLFHARNPKDNYLFTKKAMFAYIPVCIILTLALYYWKGTAVSVCVCALFIMAGLFDFYSAKTMLSVQKETALTQAYKNGTILIGCGNIVLAAIWIYAFGWLYGIILSLVIIVFSYLSRR